MEKKATSGIMLTLLLTSMLTLAFNIQPVRAEPKTWTVDDDGPADFNTIQEAINAANTGDTVLVHSGTYYENVFVNKTISLLGENKETTIIDGRGGNVVALNASNVSIIAFTLRNGHTGVDGGLWKSDNNTIEDNIITSCWTRGIFFGRYSNGNNVSGNIISNNGFSGIHLEESHSNTISGNTITNHSYANILFYPSSHNTIRTNTIQFSEGYGIASMSYSDYNVIVGNTITDNSIGVYLNQAFGDSVFHNNFINNGNQAYNYGSANTWDDGYPSGGNYWSDYSINYPVVGDDYQGESQDVLGSDGIWDHPYEIDASNLDNYPLTEPWIPVETKVGVEVGDWVKYGNFDVSWSSNDPDATMPVGIAILGELEWWENSVEDILDTKIRYQQLLHFKDGSEYSTTCWIDIDTGSGTPLSFVSSGLISDDCIYASAPWYAWKINETISHVCAGVNRETNHLNVTTSMQMGPPPLYPNTTGNFYWDKKTGVLCELSMIHLNQTETYVTSWSVFYKIVDTNLWKAPVVSAPININPDTLHPRSHGRWITAYIQLPEDYNPADINASTILLNGTIAPVLDPKYDFVTNSSEYLVDHNNDEILERMVKFDRAEVESFILDHISLREAVKAGFTTVTLTVTGELSDGTPFQGSDTIKIICTVPQKL